MKIISVNWKNESSNKIFLCNLINFCLKTKSEESTGSRWDSSNSRPELKDNVSVSVKCLQLFLLSHPRAMTRKPCQIFISDHVADKKHGMYNVPTTYIALSHTSVLVVILVITELCVVEMRGGGGVTGWPPTMFNVSIPQWQLAHYSKKYYQPDQKHCVRKGRNTPLTMSNKIFWS